MPYPVGSYREAWASYPVLVRQYRPEHNGGIVLSQIPPAADVWLCWLCDAGHVFVATPDEQRHRPGRERRRSSWCPECSELAAPRALPMRPPMAPAAVVRAQAEGMPTQGASATGQARPAPGDAGTASGQAWAAPTAGGAVPAAPSPPPRRRRGSSTGLPSTTPRAEASRSPEPSRASPTSPLVSHIPTERASPSTGASRTEHASPPTGASRTELASPAISGSRTERSSPPARAPRPTRASRPVCDKTPALPTGTPFVSACAPKPASAVEAELRAGLTARLEFEPGLNAVRVGRPFFDHVEVWPDIVLSELRVAIEYDSTGRHGLEHVGHRETADRRKDAALRAAGWEVVRLRTGKLPRLGPHDLQLSGLTRQTVPLLLDELRAIRGPLLVDAYLRR